MKKKNGSIFPRVANILIFLIFITLILYFSHYIYLNFPRAPEKLKVENSPSFEPTINSEIKQFYPNMKFNHNKISYIIGRDCNSEKKLRMEMAFQEVSKNVPVLIFYESVVNPEIEISCTEREETDIEEKHFVAGEGGAKEIIQTGNYNVITRGVILLYENAKIRLKKCDYPNVELHELLHVLGFDHSEDKRSILYPYIESCTQVLDKSIIKELNDLYSKENLPDLYFDKIDVVKRGIYLDFDLTAKNSGSIKAQDVKLTIIDGDIIIEEKDLGDFDFGSGITLKVENLKLKRLDPDSIKFILDKENKIKELNETNNIIDIKL